MKLRRFLVALGLAAAAAGSWWLAGDRGAAPPPPPDAADLPPGYYLRDARLLTMNEQGTLAHVLEADEARQERDGAPVRLRGVRMRYSADEDVAWALESARAEVGPAVHRIRLYGGVEARTRPGTGRRIVLRTDSLWIDPESDRAWSDGLVNLETEDGTLRSRGLVAFLREDRLQLESEVHGRFEP